ncbi:MAG: L-2-amino-thiazoline-4-carboxylic acid hydrolase, partial [Beijerinckiaceae bacterium]
LDVLTERHGAAAAEQALAESCLRRGKEVAPQLFDGVPAEPEAVARRFLSVSPDGGDLYPHATEVTDGSFTIAVHSCPLKDAWVQAGLAPERVAQLCRIAGEFDRGLFEAAGVRFDNSTWSEARGGGCCRITLSRR